MKERIKIFDPAAAKSVPAQRHDPAPGDLRDGRVYYYDRSDTTVVDAVNVALFANRPLLVSGKPGSGKSSLAANLARRFGMRYYSMVVSSRTQASDLLWTSDTIRRLADAQTQRLKARDEFYSEPGVLWWAFNPNSARRRGLGAEMEISAADLAVEPDELSLGVSSELAAVVLIDEIDKADPDVPNDLLVPLGSYEFRHPGGLVRAHTRPLVVVTTNGERDLPPAFERRCIELKLKLLTVTQLVEIAKLHFGEADSPIYVNFAERTCEAQAAAQPGERIPSTAEFLDAIHAWRGLSGDMVDQELLLNTIANLAIHKSKTEAN